MRLLLIRHGESVDNVAGLYAGSRDSSLTNHGVLQTKRLGSHLARRQSVIGPIKFIFTSNLQRAYNTAEAVVQAVKALKTSKGDECENPHAVALEVLRLPELREKDFGSSEGKKYGVKNGESGDGLVQSDSESRESMIARINRFLDIHLLPVARIHADEDVAVVVVAHGIILSVLLKILLAGLPAPSASGDFQPAQNSVIQSDFQAAWSNTGVLQAKIVSAGNRLPSKGQSPAELDASPLKDDGVQTEAFVSLSDHSLPRQWRFVIEFTNNLDHLQGLKKTRGGIGSAKFDSRQRTMESFFSTSSKKRKLGESKD